MKDRTPNVQKMTKNQLKKFYTPWFGELHYQGSTGKWFANNSQMTYAKFGKTPKMKKVTKGKFRPLDLFGLR